MKIESDRSRTRLHLALLCAGAALALVGVAGFASAAETSADPTGAQLTAVIGEATQNDRMLEQREKVTEGASIQTGDDGNLAMLIDDDAVVELCAKTEMKLLRDEETGARIIQVESGTTRIILDPDADVGSLQIVSPVMVATLMGTAVIVTVDPTTGETTIASEDHKLKVESRDPNIQGSTIVDGKQKATLRAGMAPPANADDLDEEELEKLAECLKDVHGAAVASSRNKNKAPDRMAAIDGDTTLPPWQNPPGDPPGGPPGDDPTDPELEPSDINPIDEMMDDMMDPGDDFPNPCEDLPGDFCFPFPDEQLQ